MGHNGESPKAGIDIVEVSFRSCIVFDHLMITVQNLSPKIRSPRDKCLVMSKANAECGRMFESLMKEKKQNKYRALYTTGCCNTLAIFTISCNM